MNTDLIASVADKIALGITNAWDHENAMRAMVKSHAQGIFNESFFFEYLDKELHRAWRNRRPFSLAAMSWSSSDSGCSPSSAEVADLVLRNIRSSDLVAQGDTVNFWSLLPDTDANAAKNMAQRLLDAAAERFDGDLALHVGITEFSKDAAVLSTLTDAAKSALRQAQEEHTRIVVRAC
jgi:GGDEF domain-containing protein